MEAVLLIIHIIACLAMVGLVLLQRSEGGALGIGGGPGSVLSGGGATNIITRSTTIIAVLFFATTLLLSLNAKRLQASSLADSVNETSGSENSETTSDLPDLSNPFPAATGLDSGSDLLEAEPDPSAAIPAETPAQPDTGTDSSEPGPEDPKPAPSP